MPYVVQNVDPKLKWYQEMGRTQGHVANQLLQALIASQTGGGGGMFAPKNIPNPNYGQSGSLKPDIILNQSTSGLGMSPRQDAQQIKQGIMTAPPAYSTQPKLNAAEWKLLQEQQAYQQNAAQAPYDIAAKKYAAELSQSKANQLNQMTKNGVVPLFDTLGNIVGLQRMGDSQQPQQSGGFNPADLSQMENDALAGNEDAVAAYRYWKKRQGAQ